jgi:hypothetical protein
MKNEKNEAKELVEELQNLLPKWSSILSESNVFTITEKVSDKIENYGTNESIEIEELVSYFKVEEIEQYLQDGIDEVINEDFRTMIDEEESEDYSPEFNSNIEKMITDFQLSTNKIIKPYLKSIIAVEALGTKLSEEYTDTETIKNETSDTFDSYVRNSIEQYDSMVETLKEATDELILAFWENILDDEEDIEELREVQKTFQNTINEYELEKEKAENFNELNNDENALEEIGVCVDELLNLLPKWTSILSEANIFPIVEKVVDKMEYYTNNENMEIEKQAVYFNTEEINKSFQNGIEKAIKNLEVMFCYNSEESSCSKELNLHREILINSFKLETNKIIKPYLESIIPVEALAVKLFSEYNNSNNTAVNTTSDAFELYLCKSIDRYNATYKTLKETTAELLMVFWTNFINDLDEDNEFEVLKEILENAQNYIDENDVTETDEDHNKSSKGVKEAVAKIRYLLPQWAYAISEENVLTITEEVSDKIENYGNDEDMKIDELASYFNGEEIRKYLQKGIDTVINEDFKTMLAEDEEREYSTKLNLNIEILIDNLKLRADKIIKPYLESIVVVEALGDKLLVEYKENSDISESTSKVFDSYIQKSLEQYDTMVDSFIETIAELRQVLWTNIINDLEENEAETEITEEITEKFQNKIDEYESQNEEKDNK